MIKLTGATQTLGLSSMLLILLAANHHCEASLLFTSPSYANDSSGTHQPVPHRPHTKPGQASRNAHISKSDEAAAHLNLGELQARQGKKKEAMANLVEALRLRPDFAEAHSSIGDLLAAEGKSDEAIRHYTQAIRLKPGMTGPHLGLAGMLTVKGRYEEAIQQYKAAVHINPKLWNAQYNLGDLLVRQGNTADAIKHYSAALRLKPDDKRIRASLDKTRELQKTRIDKSSPDAK